MQSIAIALARGLLVCAATTALASLATAEPQSQLTLKAALDAAEQYSLALKAEESAAEAAKSRADLAGQLPDPTLKLSIDNLPVDGPMQYSAAQDFMTMRSVGMSQTWVKGSKRAAATSAFNRDEDVAKARRLMTLTELRQATASAWFKSHFSAQRVEWMNRLHAEITRQIQAESAQYRADRGTANKVLTLQNALARLEARTIAAQTQLEEDNLELKRWTGQSLPANPADEPDLAKTRFKLDHLAQHIDKHPDIALMNALEQKARAEVVTAEEDKSADVSYSVMYSLRGPAYSNMLSFGVSVPLQIDPENRQDKLVQAREALARKAERQRMEATREHLAQTEQWWAQWQGDLKQLAVFDEKVLPLSKQDVELTMAAYRAGHSSLNDVLDARSRELQAQLDRLQLAQETALQWLKLEYLLPEDTNP
ncbi:TolC family protein [Limnobacter litoralis]|uniref:Transporter n=1 Tax=Limnobacter litoralis TaxID=481366 RepID=A0ABQ5YPQ1_9BURK|nr:TolC family protein [Limnobacter litoralis]GLR25211.1 transporter [Limnobacter litoralis]